MARDLYQDLAERYDWFYDEFGTHDPIVVRFFRQLFDEKQVHRVLDWACRHPQC
jgi:hypothetical protein